MEDDSPSRRAAEDAKRFLSVFRKELSQPEFYLESNEALKMKCLAGVKVLFTYAKRSGGALPTGPLQQLYTADFDEDQVWEEVQLTNEPAVSSLCDVVGGMEAGLQLVTAEEEGERVGKEEERVGKEEEQRIGKEEEEEGMGEEGEMGGERDIEDEESVVEVQNADSGGEKGETGVGNEDIGAEDKTSERHRRSSIDDAFFSLSDMERYLEEADRLSDPGSDGSVGALAEEVEGRDFDQLHYQDFFSPPLTAGVGGGAAQSAAGEQLSTHEKRQQKLTRQIRSIESANVQPKSWQMSGEAYSHTRPLNSLLEEAVDFDPMMAPPPVISEETTRSIEDIIRQRILDQAWDDVQRKVKPPEKPYDYQRARPLTQEKSKRSLAEIYEDDYIRQTKETVRQLEGASEDLRHSEVEELKKRLFLKLDALSNFHFTPKPLQTEAQVVSNVSAIVMEEVTPSATAQHTLLAPEEVQAQSRALDKGDSERTAADKRRQRLARKWLKRKRGLKPQLRRSGSTVTRGSRVRQRKQSSRYFFASLQQQQMEGVANRRAPPTAQALSATKSSTQYLL